MGISIHDRVKTIKNEAAVTPGGSDDAPLPKHGATHAAEGSDPTPPEIDGIAADMAGIVDGQVPSYDATSDKFVPGDGGGGSGGSSTGGVPAGVVDGVNMTFTMPTTIGNLASCLLLINGVLRYPGTDFTISGTVITTAFAPTAGSKLYFIHGIELSGTSSSDKQVMWDAGYAQKQDLSWKLAVDVDGDLMDPSVGNENVLHRAKKYKRRDDNTWEFPQTSNGTTQHRYYAISSEDDIIYNAGAIATGDILIMWFSNIIGTDTLGTASVMVSQHVSAIRDNATRFNNLKFSTADHAVISLSGASGTGTLTPSGPTPGEGFLYGWVKFIE